MKYEKPEEQGSREAAAQSKGPTGELLRWLQRQQGQMVNAIRRLVEIESPSDDKAALDFLSALLADEFQKLGGSVKLHHQRAAGDHLQVNFGSQFALGQKPVLLLGHHDTVWQLGTLKSMPCRVDDGHIWGPGALDMKSGIAQMMFAIRAWQEAGGGLPRPVTVLLVSDEEVGSATSRAITEDLARRSHVVLVLEPGQGTSGALKTSRKGVGEYVLKVHGRAAHAGLDFGAGASAIVELAAQIQNIKKFTDIPRGITVNPGTVRGGTRTNVVAAEAEVAVDVRIGKRAQAAALDKKFRGLRPSDKRCKLEVSGGMNRLPMERTPAIAELFSRARHFAASIAEEEGQKWQLQEAASGGGSDGNFTAALGIPTLDGLGAVGQGAHASNESVIISELPRRTALLAALIAAQ